MPVRPTPPPPDAGPVNLVVDIATGEETYVPLTEAEIAERATRAQEIAAHETKRQQRQTRRTTDVARVRQEARTNPAFAALVRLVLGDEEPDS